jgi:hypothetical protein
MDTANAHKKQIGAKLADLLDGRSGHRDQLVTIDAAAKKNDSTSSS